MKVSRICCSFKPSALPRWVTLYENSSSVSLPSHLIFLWLAICSFLVLLTGLNCYLNCSFKATQCATLACILPSLPWLNHFLTLSNKEKNKSVYDMCFIGIYNFNLLYFQISIKCIKVIVCWFSFLTRNSCLISHGVNNHHSLWTLLSCNLSATFHVKIILIYVRVKYIISY